MRYVKPGSEENYIPIVREAFPLSGGRAYLQGIAENETEGDVVLTDLPVIAISPEDESEGEIDLDDEPVEEEEACGYLICNGTTTAVYGLANFDPIGENPSVAFAAWIKPSGEGDAVQTIIAHREHGAFQRPNFVVTWSVTNNNVSFQGRNGIVTTPVNSLMPGSWHLVVVVFAEALASPRGKIWIDGVDQTLTSNGFALTAAISTLVSIPIGCDWDGEDAPPSSGNFYNFFSGQISGAAVWWDPAYEDGANLIQSDIDEIYAGGDRCADITGIAKPPLILLKMDGNLTDSGTYVEGVGEDPWVWAGQNTSFGP